MPDEVKPTDPTPPPPADWRQQWKPLVWWAAQRLALLALGAIAAWLGVQPATVERIVNVPVPVADEFSPPVNRDGWTPDADAADRDARQAVFRNFAATPAGQVAEAELPKFVYLWQAVEKLTGKPTPMKDQNPTGSCVGFGSTTAVERSLATEILHRNGDPSEFSFFSEEVTYAGSKVQGARALGASVSRQDGSAGVFVKAFFAAGYGMCPEGKYGSLDLTDYDAARAHSWNTSGPPAEILAVCRKYPVRDAAKITSWDQAKKALASGYGIMGCANWSYARQRDRNGVAAATREGWDHSMAIDGYYVDPATGKEYGHVENSWSDIPDGRGNRMGPYHVGPTGWGNPTGAGFWATADSLDKALRQGDSFALSGVTGFPARKLPLDWFIRNDARPKRERDPFALKPEVSLSW